MKYTGSTRDIMPEDIFIFTEGGVEQYLDQILFL